MTLAAAGRAEQNQIGALVQPGIAGGERHDLGLADHRNGIEVEGVDGFAGRQPSLGKMTLDTPAAALGHLVLGQGGKEARRRPSLLVGLGGNRRPDLLDGGQPQLGEKQFDAGGIDRDRSASCRTSQPGRCRVRHRDGAAPIRR